MNGFADDEHLTDNQTGKLDPDYAAEVERMTEVRETAYAAELRYRQGELTRAEKKAKRAVRAGLSKHKIAVLNELAEIRRQDLIAFERLMTSSPASSQHRGDRSYRKASITHGSLL